MIDEQPPKDPFEEMLEQTWTCPTCGDVNPIAIIVCPICHTVIPKEAVHPDFEDMMETASSILFEQLLEDASKAIEQESMTTAGETMEVEELWEEVESFFREHFYLGEEDWAYRICTLWCLQTAVAKVLPVWFYVFPEGPIGSGKTELIYLLALVSGGLVLGNVSPAALARKLDEGATVLIDEYDSTKCKEFDEIKDALFREGYRRGGVYTRALGPGPETIDFNIGGPKAATFRGEIDEALLSRGFALPTVRYHGPKGVDYVHKLMFAKAGDLPQRLRQWGQRIMKGWSVADCEEMVKGEVFREKLERAVPTGLGATREAQLGTIALIVSEMIGVDVTDDIHRAFELTSMVTELANIEDLDELYDILEQFVTERISPEDTIVKVKNAEFKQRLNRYRRTLDKPPLSQKKFSQLRRDAGLVDQFLHRLDGRAVFWIPPDFIDKLRSRGK